MTISLDPVAERDSVRHVQAVEAGRLSRALAQAFCDDPVFRWFFHHERRRFDRIVRFFHGIALERSTLPHGHVYTTGSIAGGALWIPPGATDSSLGDTLRMLPEMVRVTGRDIGRALRAMSLMESVHPHEPHWYLWFVGVAPEWQGAGIGSALMQPILERADTEAMPAYLEATTPLNRRLYERHGFKAVDEITLPGGPPMWPMWREPVTG